MTDHKHYEILCALAASGQLDALERADFDEHRMHCTDCRDRLQDLNSIGVQLQWNAALQATSTSMSAGSLERFRTRTVREGLAPRSAPPTSISFYAQVTATALFIIVASLVVMPQGRKATERPQIASSAPIANRQSLAVSVNRQTPIPLPSKAVSARFGRHGRRRLADTRVVEVSLAAPRLPRMLAANYSYFGPQLAKKVAIPDYPTLSGLQISRLDLFQTLGESQTRDAAGTAPYARPTDIASTGQVFDFAAQIRQLHFQLPISQ